MYYVDFASGLDTNAGTSPSAPWKHSPGDADATGVTANTTLRPGDTVVFRGGVVYNGTIGVDWSGTAGAPITYDGNSRGTFGSGRAIVDGEGQALGMSAFRYGFVGTETYVGTPTDLGVSYVTIDNFEIRDLRYIWDDELGYGDGSTGVSIGGLGSNVTVENCWIHDIQPIALAVNNNSEVLGDLNPHATVDVSNAWFSDSAVDLAQYAGTPSELARYQLYVGWGSDDYTIAWGYIGPYATFNRSLEVFQDINLTTPGWDGSDPVGAASAYGYSIFDVLQGGMYDKGSAPIAVSDHANTTIVQNALSDAGTGIGLSLDNYSTIADNDISNVSWGIAGGSGEVLGQNLTHVTFLDNHIHDFYPYVKYGYWSGWHGDGIYLFAGSGTPTFMEDILFEGNIFTGYIPAATALIYCEAASWSNVTIYDNVFAAAGSIAVRISPGAPYVFRDFRFYNNDFVNVPLGDSVGLLVQGTLPNVTLRNNLFWYLDSYGGDFSIDPADLAVNGSDYNLLGDDYLYDGIILANGTYNLSEWAGSNFAFPHDQHSVLERDPDFTNFPAFMSYLAANGSASHWLLEPPEDGPNYALVNHTFEVGDRVEYQYDGVVRTVTAVGPLVTDSYGSLPAYIDVTPALDQPQPPMAGEMVLDWRADTNFTFNLRPEAGSPVIGAGENLVGTVPAVDANGSARNLTGPWDIGAYVFAPAAPVSLSSVVVQPASATVPISQTVAITAVPVCSATCPSNVTFRWTLSGSLGVLNSSSGAQVTFRAGNTSGLATLVVDATLNGRTVSSHAVNITISGAPSAGGGGLLGESAWVWIGLVVTVVAAAVVVAWRVVRRSHPS
ncbi:MAG TPA: right-handed parallel beta-helix repeat-containing protein [Thermoplasmata archaeon]|nr:right-handed parallel beta-helix repeat-containing protein [Thermoplasmata archaeon]